MTNVRISIRVSYCRGQIEGLWAASFQQECRTIQKKRGKKGLSFGKKWCKGKFETDMLPSRLQERAPYDFLASSGFSDDLNVFDFNSCSEALKALLSSDLSPIWQRIKFKTESMATVYSIANKT